MVFPDYVEFINALDANGVRYLIVGAQALGFHVRPRATKDLDILFDPTPANAKRVLASLRTFFGTDFGHTVEALLDIGTGTQFGVEPVRIDLFAFLPGTRSFALMWRDKVDAGFGSTRAHYIGLEDLLRMKESSERGQDRVDAEHLRKAKDYIAQGKKRGKRK